MSKKFTIFIIILFTFAALFIGFLILKSYYPHSFEFFSEQDKKEKEEDAKQIQYMAHPRACALCEVLWSPRDDRNLDAFLTRLKRHLQRLDAAAVNFRPLGEPSPR